MIRCRLLIVTWMLAIAFPAAAYQGSARRLTAEEISNLPRMINREGLSQDSQIRVVPLIGNPEKRGRYVVRLLIPAHTTVFARMHSDLRTGTVVAGTWHFGYGTQNDPTRAKDLPAGSFFTEPAETPIFGATVAEGAVIDITGNGPSNVKYLTK